MREQYKITKTAKGKMVVAGYCGTSKGRAVYMVMNEIKTKAEGEAIIRGYMGSEAAAKRELYNWNGK